MFGSTSSRRSRRAGSSNTQRLIRASRSSRNRPAATAGAQVAIGARDQLEIALDFLVRAHGGEALLLDGLEQHGLLVDAELADLIEKHHAAVRFAKQAGAIGLRAGKGTFHVSEQRRERRVSTQSGAVHLDELALNLMARFLQARRCGEPASTCRRRWGH